MIAPRQAAGPHEVARHYDELGALYRHLWCDHLHHGLWDETNPDASIEEAAERLSQTAVAPLGLRAGQSVIDIGCGYGATARWIAERTGAQVSGLTISPGQAAVAEDWPAPSRGGVEIRLGDWLESPFPNRSFDAAVAIESLSHFADKPAFFRELARVLRPGGRAVVADWMCAPDLSWPERLLLRKLCRDGRLPGIGSFDEYSEMLTTAGLQRLAYRDLSLEAAPTWAIIARRALALSFRRPALIPIALRECCRHPRYMTTLPAIVLAYRTGALRYGTIWLERTEET